MKNPPKISIDSFFHTLVRVSRKYVADPRSVDYATCDEFQEVSRNFCLVHEAPANVPLHKQHHAVRDGNVHSHTTAKHASASSLQGIDGCSGGVSTADGPKRIDDQIHSELGGWYSFTTCNSTHNLPVIVQNLGR